MATSLPDYADHLQVGESVLRALAATTPQLPQVQLPNADPQATTNSPPSPSKLPEHRYKLEGEIARGGMGAVLRGRDEDLGREIAVKVMLQNHAGKTELLQRFVEEAQIAGQLQHPGITPVYELGRFPDQRPYFTMKLVRGQTLAKLLKDRSDPSSERPRFLKVFEQICQTLAYAHTRKVIHRDLKPHNIMVGSFGEVQVMDWGLAKVLTAPEHSPSAQHTDIPMSAEGSVQTKRSSGQSTDIPNTQAGSVLGTPAYMAPEQARGDIDQLDERADVFGLGAILCEILTGQPPYVGENGLEIYRQAEDAELADAINRLDQCGADAELISLAQQCLSAKLEDRPRDASALTNELTSYLHSVDERLKQAELSAVEARTKASEEAKRRRVTIQLAAAILLTLLAGLAGSLWQMKRAIDAEELAKYNEATALKERDEKEVQRQKAQKRLEQVEKGTTLLAEMLNGINPRNAEKGGPPLYQQLLTGVEQAVDNLQPEIIADPVVVARLQVLLGNTLLNLGNSSKAESALLQALPVLHAELGPHEPETIIARTYLADFYRVQGNIRKSIEAYQAIKDSCLPHLPHDHLYAKKILNNLAALYKDAGNYRQAIEIFEQLVDIQSGLHSSNREDLVAFANLAMVYLAMGRTQESLSLSEKVVAKSVEHLGDTHIDTLTNKTHLASVYLVTGRQSKAIELSKQISEIQKQKFGDDHYNTLVALNNLAGKYIAAGQIEEGIRIFQEVSKVYEQKYSEDHPERIRTLSNLGTAYYNAGKFSEAIAFLTNAGDLQKRKLGATHADTLLTYSSLARVLRATGKVNEAIKLFESVRTQQINVLGETHFYTIQTTNNLAEAYRSAGQLPKTVELLESVVHAQVNNFGIEHPDTLIIQGNLSHAYLVTGRIREAVNLIEKTVQEVEKQQFRHRFEPVPSLVESSTPGLPLSRSGVEFEESILESSK